MNSRRDSDQHPKPATVLAAIQAPNTVRAKTLAETRADIQERDCREVVLARSHYITPFFIQKILWIPVRLLFHVCAGFKVEGLENLHDLKTNAIFAANHCSELDVVFLPAALPFWSRFSPVFYVNRAQGMYGKNGFRRFLYNNSLFAIAGGHQYYPGLKDYEKSLINHIRLLKDGKNLYVFPEGGITPDGEIKHAHGGVAYLSLRTLTPIVPMSISGHFGMTPADFFLGRRRITVRFGRPIFPQELKSQIHADRLADNIYKAQAEAVMGRVKELIVQVETKTSMNVHSSIYAEK
jgi:1-acyl-sn-glycerol-3-phosphate acyltransferase